MIIDIKDITKSYGSENPILGPINLQVKKGEFVAVVGRSGSGKSTLMNLLAGLDKPTKGEIIINDQSLSKIDLTKYRGSIGIIFQSYNLLPNLNVIENLFAASWTCGKSVDIEHAKKLLVDLGISHRETANIKTLSGGEKQRVAIARSLMNKPEILFCDEPTGALDSKNETQVIEILKKLNQEQNITIVMITHNPGLENFVDRVIKLEDGKIIN